MDTDGVQTGFDCELTHAVSQTTHIPVIASGGAGKPEDFERVLTAGCADAALAASIFHYGTYTVKDLKDYLHLHDVPVRPRAVIIPCIDLMDGKVVQLVQGREKALEGGSPLEMLEQFSRVSADPGDRSGRGHGQRLERRAGGAGGFALHRARGRRSSIAGARTRADRTRRISRDRRHGGFRSGKAHGNRRCRGAGPADHRARFEGRQGGHARLAGSDRTSPPRK